MKFFVTMIIVILFSFQISTPPLYGGTQNRKIPLSEEVLLQFPISFCVTEDNLFVVVDFKAGDVKLYNNDGKLTGVIGSKGYGPNEFSQPLQCDYRNGKLLISDAGQTKIFVYQRKDCKVFTRTGEVLCSSVGEDIKLRDGRIYFAGTKFGSDGVPNAFYSAALGENLKSFSLDDKSYIYYLPSHLKFGFDSVSEYRTELYKKGTLTAIGVLGIFDILGDFAYFAWEGDLKIFKIDLKTKRHITFGKKTPLYNKPKTTKRILEAFRIRKFKDMIGERKKLSYVKKVIAAEKYVLLIYDARKQGGENEGSRLQYYSHGGKFLKEEVLPGDAGRTTWMDKKNNILYMLTSEYGTDDSIVFYVHTYHVK